MKHFPIFLDLEGAAVVVAGGGEAALAKLRLLLKTRARISVYAETALPAIVALAEAGKLALIRRSFAAGDATEARLVYAASEEDAEDARVAAIARAEGVLVNSVDNLAASDFITPAMVDRDPVCVAIGTEGAAPVLARSLKAELEARLPANLGPLARIGQQFRKIAEALPLGRARREFWSDYYDGIGPRAYAEGGAEVTERALEALFDRHLGAQARAGHVDLAGAGPGDPELLTLKTRRALDRADVILHDRLVPAAILELARREAIVIEAGKEGFGPGMTQAEIGALMVEHAERGAHVVRLKSGDPTIFGRLDEEIEALDAAGISWSILPGITAASAAVAAVGQSLTRRGRNSGLRIVTGHDMDGFADHDWRGLTRPGEVAAIYMAKRAARFIQGRLLMHGASPETPVSVVENAARPDQRIIGTTLADLPDTTASLAGPAVLLYGLAPRRAAETLPELMEAYS
ncbi:uroporphyrinogen-III C-methyltransferase [Thioclava sp. BHET1]|nr:uroporphyrinogen-III C-methyltransferase [Thioclava sp. BHET1]